MGKTAFVVCGSIALDRIMHFSGNYHELIDAEKIEVLSLSVLVDSLQLAEGGIGANIAHNMAQLGQTVSLLGTIGSDGLDYLKRLESSGIDVSSVHHSSLPTASFSALTDSAGNQVGGFYPGAMTDASSLSFVPFAQKHPDLLACLSAHDPIAMRRQSEECLKHNIRLVYDPGQQTSSLSSDDLRHGIAAAEIVFVNEYESNLLVKRTGLELDEIAARLPLLVITHGKHGSRVYGKSLPSPLEISAVKPDKIVDPTGAGDAYRAGFLYGYLRQWEVRECGELGSVTASFALEHHGPQGPLSLDAIFKRYEKTYKRKVHA